jgi:hypothetical protein
MSTAASAIQPHAIPREQAAERAGARLLVVPIGGTGWGWALLARYAFVFSLAKLTWIIPYPIQPAAMRYLDFGASYLSQNVQIFEAQEANGRFITHLVPLILAIVWLLVDRKRKHDVFIHEAGQTIARFAIACILSSYSLEKTFGSQGSHTYVSYSGLLPAYGVHWRQFAVFLWLGQSIIYENFAALVEMLPLLLAPFRRLAVWSALVALAACLNVFVVNAGHWNLSLALTPVGMMILPMFVLAPHTKRFAQLFLGRPVEPLAVGYLTPPALYWPVSKVVKAAVVLWAIYAHNHFPFAAADRFTSSLGGLYEITSFSRNGKAEPLAAEYPNRWREVAIGRSAGGVSIMTVDNEQLSFTVKQPGDDPRREHNLEKWTALTEATEGDLPYFGAEVSGLEHGTLEVGSRARRRRTNAFRADSGSFHYTHPTPDQVTLSGVIAEDTVRAVLKRVDFRSSPLYRYRLYPEHWRQEIALWARDHGWIYPY